MGEKAQSQARAELLSFQHVLQQWPVLSEISTSAAQVRLNCPCGLTARGCGPGSCLAIV